MLIDLYHMFTHGVYIFHGLPIQKGTNSSTRHIYLQKTPTNPLMTFDIIHNSLTLFLYKKTSFSFCIWAFLTNYSQSLAYLHSLSRLYTKTELFRCFIDENYCRTKIEISKGCPLFCFNSFLFSYIKVLVFKCTQFLQACLIGCQFL